jgi:hypothetical protein
MMIDSLYEVLSSDFKLYFGMVRFCMSLLSYWVNMGYIVCIVTSCSDALALVLQTRLTHRMNCLIGIRIGPTEERKALMEASFLTYFNY